MEEKMSEDFNLSKERMILHLDLVNDKTLIGYPEPKVKEFIQERDEIDRELWRKIDKIIKSNLNKRNKSDLIDKEFVFANEKKDKLAGDKLI